MLKDAKDACASEALEIATYTAIERTAQTLGDDVTARLAASIRAEEERALARLLREIPRLADAVIEVDVEGNPSSYELGETGAADKRARPGRRRQGDRAGGAVAGAAGPRAPPAGCPASQGPRERSRAPSPPRQDLPISGYDDLNADEVTRRLPGLSQIDLAKIDAYERRGENRTTILSRIALAALAGALARLRRDDRRRGS